jgi:peptidoglycan-associated lipoprotein
VSTIAPGVPDRIFFDFDSSTITAEGQDTLQKQANYLKEHSDVAVTVEGHCDERGTREYNLALGERRASASKNYLVSLGVEASRIQTISYGKERPAVIGDDESAWSQNRRAVTVKTVQ